MYKYKVMSSMPDNTNIKDTEGEQEIVKTQIIDDTEETEKPNNTQETEDVEQTEKISDNLSLELGCIVRINSPNNEKLHNNIYFIDYLDNNIIKLLSYETYETHELRIINNKITDESIESIHILERPSVKGYAKQNNLVIDKMITIEFGGDEPMIINGKITNLEEDMIEIKMIQNSEFTNNIYIDFEYKGLPLDLNIVRIVPFKSDKLKLSIVEEEVETIVEEDEEYADEYDDEIKLQDTETLKDDLQDLIIKTDEIIIGDLLGEIKEDVYVKEGEKRYALDIQLEDLLDDMLSTIPNDQRKDHIIDEIHLSIHRFKEMREMYSEYDNKGIPSNFKKKSFMYKPLLNNIKELTSNVGWILPITKTLHKVVSANDLDDRYNHKYSNEKNTYIEEFKLKENFKANNIQGDDKYMSYNRQMGELYKPFKNSLDMTNILYVGEANANVQSIVDNDGNYYSKKINVISKGKNKDKDIFEDVKYELLKYNKGEQETRYDDFKKLLNPRKLQITENEKLHIRGYMKLPYTFMEKYKMHLPETSIMEKINSHQQNTYYWDYLTEEINVKNEKTNGTQDMKKYLLKPRSYMYKESARYDDRDVEETFSEFLNNIIPTTNDIIDIVNPIIDDGINIDNVMKHLEPFHIYKNDLTFSQYTKINDIIQNNIDIYIKTILSNTYKYENYVNLKYTNQYIDFIADLFENSENSETFSEELNTKYAISNIHDTEQLNKMMQIDNGMFLKSAIFKNDLNLFQDVDLEKLVEENIANMENIQKELEEKDDETNAECREKFTLAKRYDNIDELMEDENNVIYFDKRYDETIYGIMESEFSELVGTVGPEELYDMVKTHLMGMGVTKDIDRETSAHIEGKKRIEDGDYALLHSGDNEYRYYIRKNARWILDESKTNKTIDQINFCNLKDSCIKINENCNSDEVSKLLIKEKLLKNIADEFENSLEFDYKEMEVMLNKNYADHMASITKKMKLIENKKRKYNNSKIDLIEDINLDEIVVSPYAETRDILLSLSDISLKYEKILLFVSNFCRINNPGDENENKHWFYCKDTDTPLLPTFFHDLAIAFENNNYESVMAEVEKTRGTLSDDGDKVVDKYSGYYIKNILYDNDEGYDESGYKYVSRSVENTKDDIDKIDKLLEKDTDEKQDVTVFNDEQSKRVLNVIRTLDNKLKINVSSEYEFIVKYAKMLTEEQTISRDDFRIFVEEKMKKGKQVKKKYENIYAKSELSSIVAAYILGSQTSKQHLNSSLTYGTYCIKSFSGFPVYGNADMSFVKYVCCCILNLKSKANILWKNVPKTNSKNFKEKLDNYVNDIKEYINELLKKQEIIAKINNKKLWDLKNKEIEKIPTRFDVKEWGTFLPHLKNIEIKKLKHISSAIDKKIKDTIKQNSITQFGYLGYIKGKSIQYSNYVQFLIQRIVEREPLLLITKSEIPYKENACCNDARNTVEYFFSKNKELEQSVEYVKTLNGMLQKYKSYDKCPSLVFTNYTKTKQTELSNTFHDFSIYSAFLKYCKYNSKEELPEEFKQLCEDNTMDFSNLQYDESEYADYIKNKISIMKEKGHEYKHTDLVKLLNIISKKNLSDIQKIEKVNEFAEFEKTIDEIMDSETKDDIRYENFNSLMIEMKKILKYHNKIKEKNDNIELFEMFVKNNITKMKNKLKKKLETLEYTRKQINAIIGFIENMTSPTDDKNGFWKIINGTHMNNEDETNHRAHLNISDFIVDFLKYMPNRIITGHKKQETKDIIDSWGVSFKHQNDILNHIKKEYSFVEKKEEYSFERFYKNKEMIIFMKELLGLSKGIQHFMENVFLKISNKKLSLFNGKYLKMISSYVLLFVFNMCFDMSETIRLDEDDDDEETIADQEFLTQHVRQMNFNKNIGDYIYFCSVLFSKRMDVLNFTNNDIELKIKKMKQFEKKKITKGYEMLRDDERELEKVLQNIKEGRWRKGLQDSVYKYSADVYDEEREEIINDFINNPDEISEYIGTSAYDNEYMESMRDMQVQMEIDGERYNMMNLAEDDDYGEFDGDEFLD